MHSRDDDRSGGGRSVALILAALAATGWGFAFYASYGAMERERLTQETVSVGENALHTLRAREAALEAREQDLARQEEVYAVALAEIVADKAVVREELAAKNVALETARAELESITTQIRKARDELAATQERRSDLEASLVALQNDIDRLGSERATRVATASPGMNGANGSPAALNAALARLDRTIDARSGELRRIEAEHEQVEARFAAVSQDIEQADAALALTNQETREAQERLSALLADVTRLDALIARRDSRASTLARTVEDLAATIAEREAELARLDAALEAARAPGNAAPARPDPRAGETRDDGARVIRVVPSGR
jgi:chromosome segregation ATPase